MATCRAKRSETFLDSEVEELCKNSADIVKQNSADIVKQNQGYSMGGWGTNILNQHWRYYLIFFILSWMQRSKYKKLMQKYPLMSQ